jgi:hypothetical protein
MYRPIISANNLQVKSFRKFLESLKPGDFLFEPFDGFGNEPGGGLLLKVKDIERYSCRVQVLAEKDTPCYLSEDDYLISFRPSRYRQTRWERIKKIDPKDLVLYSHFKFKSPTFMELLEV